MPLLESLFIGKTSDQHQAKIIDALAAGGSPKLKGLILGDLDQDGGNAFWQGLCHQDTPSVLSG